MKYNNPVLPGFYPDPSVCKWEGKYYLVTSSFQFFPGVPLFESDDLINWTQIGHVLTRRSQLPLEHAGNSDGIFAPTIRVNNGRFYMVTTNITDGGNFLVYTDDIHGEWSEPVYIKQGGIDPSLYFENDKCYFMSNGIDDNGVGGVTQCEINPETGEILSPKRAIWQGTGGRFLESPHLYKFGNTYYLMAAEGGTEYGHMVVMAKGPSPYGPFSAMKNNPILTNRNLGGYEIQGCGHADLVEDNNGNLWMIHLAFRQLDLYMMYHTIGRETYLVPVTFSGDYVLCGDNGTTRLEMVTDRLPENLVQKPLGICNFENTVPGREWIYIRYPEDGKYIFEAGKKVSLLGTTDTLSSNLSHPTFMGIRQQSMCGKVAVTVKVTDGEGGISVYMDNMHHMDVALVKSANGTKLLKRMVIGDVNYCPEVIDVDSDTAKVTIDLEKLFYTFNAEINGKTYFLGKNQSRYVSTEVAGGFCGVLIGLYAQKEEENATEPAVFTDFCIEYK